MSGERVNAKLRAILLEFSETAGGRPSLKEFLELFKWSSEAIYSAPLEFEATLADGTAYSGPAESRVSEMGDSVFTDVADFLAGLSDEDGGGPVPPNDLANILLEFVNSEAANLVDVSAGDISRLVIAGAGSSARPEVGDILAVPVDDAWYAVIVVARNRFGVAFGIFGEKFRSLDAVHPEHSSACKFPVYSDDTEVVNGSWQVVGRDEGLLSAFPAEPEIYHSPNLAFPGFDFGEFGSAESPSGAVRLIDGAEASAVGISTGSYRQAFTGKFLQQSLDDLVKRWRQSEL
ncbi:hypothetical protein QWL27_29025 [Streptomyces thermocarboxydus]|uniref:Uncharacterized protein n=1 Tax=Streptomyces cellulosae TaxID=1968 RepID=A0ABW6JPK2_STRCE|nr:hypothetical protein [Streptomyces sp. AC04842]MDN3289764.1 hypothetical protein [Streptomyces thermocarboxydus]GHE35427.1 hypothetical protein GCM10018771_14460 [Streptomyces cellulosae]GHE83614.1 hypothetical protein GCM10018789_09560 [Streptomyces werraensis]